MAGLKGRLRLGAKVQPVEAMERGQALLISNAKLECEYQRSAFTACVTVGTRARKPGGAGRHHVALGTPPALMLRRRRRASEGEPLVMMAPSAMKTFVL